MAQGSHSIVVAEFQAGQAGTRSDAVSVVVGPAGTAPTIDSVVGATGPMTGSIAPGGATTDGQPTLTGTGHVAGDVIKLYDGATLLGSTTVGANGTWSFKPSSMLSGGTHNVTASEVNNAGQMSSMSSAYSFSTNYIVVSGATDYFGNAIPKGGSVNGPVTYTGYVDPSFNGATVSAYITTGGGIKGELLYAPGGTEPIVKNGMFTFTLTYAFYANDKIPSSGNFTIDFGVTQTGGAKISSGTQVAGLNWPVVADLANSSKPGTPVLTDDSGTIIPAGSTTNDAHPNLSGKGHPGDMIKVYDGSTLIGSTSVDSNGRWTFKLSSDLSNGSHSISVLEPSSQGGVLVGSPTVEITVSKVSATFDPTVHADDQSQAALVGDTDQSAAQANHHTVVGEHDAFVGKLANGNETVDLNADPVSYFKESTAHIQGAGGTAIDTLHLTGDHQVLDLTSLTGQTAAAKISGIEVVDLGGQHNTLKLSLIDVLNLGETDLFQKDGKQQMMVQGKDGDTVDLSNAHIAGLADGEWAAHGTTQVGGVTYNVYEHSGAHTELLVQQGVQIVVH